MLYTLKQCNQPPRTGASESVGQVQLFANPDSTGLKSMIAPKFNDSRNSLAGLCIKTKKYAGEKAQQLELDTLQRTQVYFPAPTWQVTILCNSSSNL